MSSPSYPRQYLYRRIVQAKLFIDRNFHEPIDLDNISQEVFLSKFHFIRLFKKTYGQTPHQYITRVRLDKAQQLLKEGKSVSQVCSLVGFESLGSFSSLFKSNIGVSPTVFIQNHNNQRDKIAQSPLQFIPSCIASRSGWLENSNFQEVK